MANSYTPGLSLRKPAQGDDYWDDDLNANADILEAASGRGSGLSYVSGAGLAVTGGGGLSAAYAAGTCRVGGAKFTLGAGSVAVTNGLNFVYVNAAGQVEAASTPPTPPYCALALVEAAGGAVVRTGDLRRCLIDLQEEHDEAGGHKVIKPTRVEPTGTAGAYRRSASNWREPESQVNNVIIRNDPNQLWSTIGRWNGYTGTMTASYLGSNYVPADAHALILMIQVWDTANGARSRWRFYPEGTTDEVIKDSAVARVFNPPDANSLYFYYQLTVRLSAEGRFTMECLTDGGSTCCCRGRLVGWIEPA